MSEQVHFDEQSRRVMSSDDDTAEGWLIRLCQEHAINMETMLEIVAEVADHMGEGGSQRAEGGSQRADLRSPTSDLSAISVFSLFKRALRLVRCSRGPQEVADKLSYLALALGWHDELDGVDNATDLARRLGVTKANSNKYVNLFRDVLPPGMKVIPPMGGQRKEDARVTFTGKRFEQEKAKGNIEHSTPNAEHRS